MLVAALAIPVVYVVYLYDVNLWEDEPIPVVALAFGLTGLLAALFTLLWTRLVPFTISFTDQRIKAKYVTYPSPGGTSVAGSSACRWRAKIRATSSRRAW